MQKRALLPSNLSVTAARASPPLARHRRSRGDAKARAAAFEFVRHRSSAATPQPIKRNSLAQVGAEHPFDPTQLAGSAGWENGLAGNWGRCDCRKRGRDRDDAIGYGPDAGRLVREFRLDFIGAGIQPPYDCRSKVRRELDFQTSAKVRTEQLHISLRDFISAILLGELKRRVNEWGNAFERKFTNRLSEFSVLGDTHIKRVLLEVLVEVLSLLLRRRPKRFDVGRGSYLEHPVGEKLSPGLRFMRIERAPEGGSSFRVLIDRHQHQKTGLSLLLESENSECHGARRTPCGEEFPCVFGKAPCIFQSRVHPACDLLRGESWLRLDSGSPLWDQHGQKVSTTMKRLPFNGPNCSPWSRGPPYGAAERSAVLATSYRTTFGFEDRSGVTRVVEVSSAGAA
jgi:hypothetical protein